MSLPQASHVPLKSVPTKVNAFNVRQSGQGSISSTAWTFLMTWDNRLLFNWTSSGVTTMRSGVGALSSMTSKPCIIFLMPFPSGVGIVGPITLSTR